MSNSNEEPHLPTTASDDSPKSVTRLLRRLATRDEDAASEIWRRYFQRLIPLAKQKLGRLRLASIDEEDILISVFDSFFRAVENNRFKRLDDRNDLWQILLMLTERRVVEEMRRQGAQKRGAGRVSPASQLPQFDLSQVQNQLEEQLTPEFTLAFNECLYRALKPLGDKRLLEIVLLRLEGYSNREIAVKLDSSERTIERKMKVVRSRWEQEFATSR